jgi:hypothetical protein
MGALICNYLPDEASGVHELSTMNRQDSHAPPILAPSGVTLTVSCVLNRPSWPLLRGSSPGMGGKQNVLLISTGLAWAMHPGGMIDSRVGDLCNHVGFADVAAPRGCWRLFEQNKSLSRFAVERGGGAERSVAPPQPMFERKERKNWRTLSHI